MLKLRKLLTATCLSASVATGAAHAGMDPYIGELSLVANAYCQKGTAEANGQLVAINENQALYSLLGTRFGGNGVTNFALPDLRGRVSLGSGTLPGGQTYQIGQIGGAELTTMTISNMPHHSHDMNAADTITNTNSAANANLGNYVGSRLAYSPGNSAIDVALSPVALDTAGEQQPIANMQPFTVMRWCIATTGIFPSRN